MAHRRRTLNIILLITSMIGLIRQSYSARITSAFIRSVHSLRRGATINSLQIVNHLSKRGLASSSSSSSVEGEGEEEEPQGTFGAKVPFNQLGLSKPLLDALESAGKSVSTHIQALSLPPIIQGDDVIIGSGR